MNMTEKENEIAAIIWMALMITLYFLVLVFYVPVRAVVTLISGCLYWFRGDKQYPSYRDIISFIRRDLTGRSEQN